MKPSKARWSIALLILAIFFDTIEMTAVITALPTMGRSFPQAVNWLAWLTTASLLAAAVAMAVGGRIADDWGVKKTFMLGLTFSNLGSLLAGLIGYGLPKSMLLLIILRFVQGFGAGAYAPIGLKLISLVMKGGRRTQTIGVAGMVVPLAAVLGPNVGGFLVDHFPWQVIFLLNAGIGLAIMLLAGFLMEEMVTPNEKAPLDIAGIGAFSGAVVSAMLALTLARQAGSVAPLTIGLLVLAVVLAAILPRLETRSRAPFLEPALLTTRGMGVVLGLSFLQGVTMYSVLFFLSFYAQTHPSILATPTQAGALLTPGALVQMLAAPVVGRFIPRVGYRFMVAAGMLVTAGSLLAMGAGPTSLVMLAVLLALSRAGAAMASVPLAAAGLEANVQRAGAISGFRQLSNVIGGVVGPLVFSALFPFSRTGGARLTYVFVAIGVILILALPIARGMPAQEAELAAVPERSILGDDM